MKQADHNHSFTATDIQRYHTGEMSMQERHALEKAALDDPFLADALEGYQFTATPHADITALHQRLAEKTTPQRKRVYPLFFREPWMRVAAFFLLLAGAGWAVYQFSFTQKENLAVQPEISRQLQKAPTESATTSSATADSSLLVQTEVKRTPVLTTTPESTPLLTKPARKPAAKADVVLSEDSHQSPTPMAITAAPAETKLSLRAAETHEKEEATANAIVQTQPLHTFKGQVKDPSGNPVPNASVMIAGKRSGTITNMQGQFSLTAPDSVLNATVSAAGFEMNRLSFTNPSEEKQVILNESTSSLNEVVVTGYGSRRNRSTTRPSEAQTKAEVEELEPENGWSSFNNYISENLQIPEEVTSKQIKGEVELAFEVNKKGEPVNIRVEKSLCTSCDKEAIRLLQEGPGWKKKQRKNGKVKIRF